MEGVRELLRKWGIDPRCNDEQLRKSFDVWLWQLRAQEAVAEQVRAEGGVGEEVPSPRTPDDAAAEAVKLAMACCMQGKEKPEEPEAENSTHPEVKRAKGSATSEAQALEANQKGVKDP